MLAPGLSPSGWHCLGLSKPADARLGHLQEGWRAAVAERARQELTSREAAIRADLTKQRDAEIEVSASLSG